MQLFFVGLINERPLKRDFAAPYTGTEARVELAAILKGEIYG